MKNGVLQQEKVKGKYVNEVIDGNQVKSEFYEKKIANQLAFKRTCICHKT